MIFFSLLNFKNCIQDDKSNARVKIKTSYMAPRNCNLNVVAFSNIFVNNKNYSSGLSIVQMQKTSGIPFNLVCVSFYIIKICKRNLGNHSHSFQL